MKKEVIGLLIVILLIGFVCASFEVSEHKVTKEKYSPQNYFEGWVKMSFDKEPANSLFETSVSDSIEILKLLKLNNADYSCVPSDCESAYSLDGIGKRSLDFYLEDGESKIIGLKFTGEVNSIDSVNFSVESSAGASCDNQLEVDILNDDIIDKKNDKAWSETCDSLKNYGCFVNSGEFENPTIEETPYCQKINLSESAGFKVGAWVKKADSKSLEMVVYDKNVNEKARCDLPDASETGGEISCDVDFSVMVKEEYYICIKFNRHNTIIRAI